MLTKWMPLGIMLFLTSGCGEDRPETPLVPPLPAAFVTSACGEPPTTKRILVVDGEGGSDDSAKTCVAAGSGNCGAFRTLGGAFSAAAPGDRIELRAGTYDAPESPPPSGSPESPLVIASAEGEHAVVKHTLHLEGRAFVLLSGISFQSDDGRAWVATDEGSHDITIRGNAFNSTNAEFEEFGGILVKGSSVVSVCGNAFGSWLGDMVHALAVDGFLFEHNDLSRSAADHALLQVVGTRVVIRGNAFRNPWQRTFVTNPLDEAHPMRDVLIENNVVFDSNWDGESPLPDAGGPGDAAARIGGDRVVVRNNLFAQNHPGAAWECSGALSFAAYHSAESPGYLANHMEHMRLYGNTFVGNALNAFGFYGQSESLPLFADDDVFRDNVFSGSGSYHVRVCNDWLPWQTWRFSGNVFGPQNGATPFSLMTRVPGLPSGEVTLAEAETSAASVFFDNHALSPSFTDAPLLDSAKKDLSLVAVDRLTTVFQALEQANKETTSVALTKVSEMASQSKTLAVDDARFFVDGFGITAGDEILVGTSAIPVRITKIVDEKTLELAAPIDAAPGDDVFLAARPPGTTAGVRAPALP